jgi:hypothetical protein
MGFFLAAKRALVVGSIFLSTAYFGDATNIGDAITAPFRSEPTVEQGYISPNAVKVTTRKNENGTTATYLKYINSETQQELPLLQGNTGPRLGTSDYILNSLTEAEEQKVFTNKWNNLTIEEKTKFAEETLKGLTGTAIDGLLSQQQRYDIFSSKWYELPLQQKSELITEVWPQLDITYRHSIVRKELDEVLER